MRILDWHNIRIFSYEQNDHDILDNRKYQTFSKRSVYCNPTRFPKYIE